jgi:uncharacterized membrane protein
MTILSYALVAIFLALLIGFLCRGERVWLSFTFIGLLGILGLYVFDLARMPADVRWVLIDPLAYEKLLILSLGFILFFGVGEYIGYTNGYRRPIPIDAVRYLGSWAQLAMVLLVIGIFGQVLFIQSSGGFMNVYGSAHGSGGNYSSAYIYRLYHSIFTSAVILMAFLVSGQKMSRVMRIILCIALVVLFFELFTQGKRSGTIRFVLVFLVPLILLGVLTKKRKIQLIAFVSVALVFLIALPYIRFALALTTLEQLGSALREFTQQANTYTDNVTLWHEGKHVAFATIVITGSLEATDNNYGSRWLFPFINLVPRAFWPDKPFRYDFAEDFYDVSGNVSSIIVPKGSYPGGIPESFSEWWFFVLVVWFLMGLILGFLRGHAQAKKTIFSITLTYAAAVSFVHFILQDTIQAIFSLMFLIGPFMLLAGVFKILPRRRHSRPTFPTE